MNSEGITERVRPCHGNEDYRRSVWVVGEVGAEPVGGYIE